MRPGYVLALSMLVGCGFGSDAAAPVDARRQAPADSCLQPGEWYVEHHQGTGEPWPALPGFSTPTEDASICGRGLHDILAEKPRGDAWSKLAHAVIPAALNVAAGADDAAIADDLARGWALLAECGDPPRPEVAKLSHALRAFSEGRTGAACDDDTDVPDDTDTDVPDDTDDTDTDVPDDTDDTDDTDAGPVDYIGNFRSAPGLPDRGIVWLRPDGDALDVHLRLSVGNPVFRVTAVIAGFDDPEVEAACPTPAQDTDEDGILTTEEARAVTGDPVVVLADDVALDPTGALDLDDALDGTAAAPVERRVLLVSTDSPIRDTGQVPEGDVVLACAALRVAAPEDPVWYDDPAALPGIHGSGSLTVGGDLVLVDAALHCDAADFRQKLDLQVGDDRAYTLSRVQSATCAGGTFSGTGSGVWTDGGRNDPGAVTFTLVDGGATDQVDIEVTTPLGTHVLSGPLTTGDLSAH